MISIINNNILVDSCLDEECWNEEREREEKPLPKEEAGAVPFSGPREKTAGEKLGQRKGVDA